MSIWILERERESHTGASRFYGERLLCGVLSAVCVKVELNVRLRCGLDGAACMCDAVRLVCAIRCGLYGTVKCAM